jgi:thioredoxin 2
MTSIELDDRGLLVSCPKCGQRNRLKYDRLEQAPRCGKCGTELYPPGDPIEIRNDLAFDTLTTRSALPVLVDFWAPWCGPCKMVAPELNKIAREGAGHWLVAKVNTEDLQNLARRFRINAIPTMALFKDGLEVTRQVGAMAAPAIRKFLEPWLRNGKGSAASR